jgi:UDP-N-acetylglucosamine 2-epimerase (non-hydrolysing)
MIDSLLEVLPSARMCKASGLPSRYALVTPHRPANVDNSDTLRRILDCMTGMSSDLGVVFPVHPRTRQRIREFGSVSARSAL